MSVGDFLGINVCVGGDNVPRKLAVIPHVVVGTPFGVTSMISCNSLRTECIQTVVLNKVEKMLTPQYTKLIEVIMGKLVENKQVTLLTSDKLDQVLDVYMDTLRDPLVIFNENNDKEIETIKGMLSTIKLFCKTCINTILAFVLDFFNVTYYSQCSHVCLFYKLNYFLVNAQLQFFCWCNRFSNYFQRLFAGLLSYEFFSNLYVFLVSEHSIVLMYCTTMFFLKILEGNRNASLFTHDPSKYS